MTADIFNPEHNFASTDSAPPDGTPVEEIVPEVTNEQIQNHLLAVREQNDRILAGLIEVHAIVGATAEMLQSVQAVASQMNGPLGFAARKIMGGKLNG